MSYIGELWENSVPTSKKDGGWGILGDWGRDCCFSHCPLGSHWSFLQPHLPLCFSTWSQLMCWVTSTS
jgi:hypothetical protein